jgi:Tfp pilus assembly PilM family ATPase
MKSSPDAFFNKIYLTGGSANLLGLKDFISTNLNSDVELLDPFEKITLNDSLDNPYQYSVAVGCALRGIKK